jgi:hypothetical protein
MWETKKICTIQSHPWLFGWCDYEVLRFFCKFFSLSVYYYINNATLTTSATNLSSWKHHDNGAPPPLSQIMLKHG